MSFKHFLWWLAGTFLAWAFSAGTGNWLILVAYLIGTLVWWWASCQREPMRPCWRCKGKGERRSGWWRYATGHCTRCGRSGRQRRLGSVIFRIPPD